MRFLGGTARRADATGNGGDSTCAGGFRARVVRCVDAAGSIVWSVGRVGVGWTALAEDLGRKPVGTEAAKGDVLKDAKRA